MCITATAEGIDASQHLGLVWNIARTFKGWGQVHGYDLEDLVSEGTIALVKAARDFDPALGNQFSTVATPYVRHALIALVQQSKCKRYLPPSLRQGDDEQLSFVVVEGKEHDYHFGLESALGRLSPRARQVIAWRFGLEGEGELTLDEIGRRIGVTSERVRQIELKALETLRAWLSSPRPSP